MFLIETRIEGKIAILPVNDRLDTVTASEFERSITEATAGDISSLVLNFENLNYISSAG
ncbi:MAG: STAS domain-containing protein, partial [Lentisphaerae bacterium]|nr:STAS domain-containing protein [Lentisphaerota bacterium]